MYPSLVTTETSIDQFPTWSQDGSAIYFSSDRTGRQEVWKMGADGSTPTQITLQAVMQHNHDQIPYGVPPLNGFPLNVPRNTAYGFSDDFTNQDAISVIATVDHAFNKDFKLRNQTMFNYVNTYVHETSGNAVGTLAANGGFVPAANGARTAAESARKVKPEVESSGVALGMVMARKKSPTKMNVGQRKGWIP
jgi:hypothetical protein